MSTKTRTRRNNNTTRTARASVQTDRQPPSPAAMVAAQTAAASPVRTDTEDKLWQALCARPGSTSAELSAAAEIGKSTAGKILARWAEDGQVTRTASEASGGRRSPDRWTISDTDAAATDPTPPADAATNGAPTATQRRGRKRAAPQTGSAAEAPTSSSDEQDASTREDGKSARLAPGALRGLVEDYLREHPEKDFSPHQIGTALAKSSGAVNNALEKLVDDGYAVLTSSKPKRFALKQAD
jgi:hypothetical protein